MKNTIFIMMIFVPIVVLGQDKILSSDELPTEMELEKHLLWRASNDSERKIETTLIDDRNYYKSSINFDLDKSHSLSFTAKNKKLSKLTYDRNSQGKLLEVEPVLDFNWQFRKSTEQKLFEK